MQSLAVLAVRLMAAYFFVQTIYSFQYFLFPGEPEDKIFTLVASSGSLFVTLILWAFSGKIGTFISKGLEAEVKTSDITTHKLVHGGTFLIGLWLAAGSLHALFSTLPQILGTLKRYSQNHSAVGPIKLNLDQYFWPEMAILAVGILIMVFAKPLSKIFQKQLDAEK